MNKQMKYLVNEVKSKNEDYVSLIKEFTKFFCPVILEWDGCVLLQFGKNQDELPEKFIPNKVVSDRTQFEATYNHMHLSDILPNLYKNPEYSLGIALELIEILGNDLKASFPQERFHLVISHDEFGSVVRFYKIRTNEIPWINVDNIDGFKEEAILIKEI